MKVAYHDTKLCWMHQKKCFILELNSNEKHKPYRKEECIYSNEGAFANVPESSASSRMVVCQKRLTNSLFPSLEPFLS